MEKLLEIKHLNKSYHTLDKEILVLNDISFDVFKNEFISIVGPSGCGKSTILSIIFGLINNYSGNIKLKENFSIAYMLQDDCLLPYRTILDNCLIGLEVQKKLTDEAKNYILRLLKTYGLEDFIDKYPSSLSGGMRQKVALIRTLALNPDILLLDEPTSALDYQTTLNVSEDIYKIIKDEGKTAIMVTHDIPLAISMSDRIILLSERPGKIKNIYSINLSNKKNPIHNRTTKEFINYYEKIWRDLDG